MDAEAYLEASKSVLQILWEVGSSRQAGDGSQWVKARASAFEALTHYEVYVFVSLIDIYWPIS